VKSVKLSDITGSLSDYARKGLREPVVVTRRGRPVVAVMPLTKFDDWESVSLATNPDFMGIIERSRASAREQGTARLAQVRRKHGLSARATRRRRARR
jgi:prevent-host-death family protein